MQVKWRAWIIAWHPRGHGGDGTFSSLLEGLVLVMTHVLFTIFFPKLHALDDGHSLLEPHGA